MRAALFHPPKKSHLYGILFSHLIPRVNLMMLNCLYCAFSTRQTRAIAHAHKQQSQIKRPLMNRNNKSQFRGTKMEFYWISVVLCCFPHVPQVPPYTHNKIDKPSHNCHHTPDFVEQKLITDNQSPKRFSKQKKNTTFNRTFLHAHFFLIQIALVETSKRKRKKNISVSNEN